MVRGELCRAHKRATLAVVGHQIVAAQGDTIRGTLVGLTGQRTGMAQQDKMPLKSLNMDILRGVALDLERYRGLKFRILSEATSPVHSAPAAGPGREQLSGCLVYS